MARHAISASSGKKVTASAAGLPKQPTSSALATRPKTDEKKDYADAEALFMEFKIPASDAKD
jgi:hypothetical protein